MSRLAFAGRIAMTSPPGCVLAGMLVLAAFMLLSPMRAHAQIQIDIPDVSPLIESNIRAFLSLTRYMERDDLTPETISRLQRRIVTETRQALEPLGYYEPEVEHRSAREGEGWRVTILVKPGRPMRVSEVNINVTGPGADARAIKEVIAADELKPGLRLNHGTYERVKAQLLRTAKNDGYLDAKLSKHELLLDRDERRARITIDLATGERYRFGAIETVQDVIDDDAMRRLLRMREGDPYTLDTLLRTQYVLDDSQYFSLVDIDSGDADPQTHSVPITIRAEANSRHRYAISLGYGTDTKVRGKFIWDNRLVNRAGHRFKVELTGSSVVKELAGRYVIPVMDIALEKLEFTASAREEELGDTLSERIEIGSGLTQALGRWQRAVFLRLSNEKTTVPGNELAPRSEDTAFLIIPGISYATLPSYVLGGRARPYNLYAELRGSPSTFGSDASFLQLRMQAERIFDLSELYDLRIRAEFGTSWVADFSELPASQRFFAGGDRSVRGFGLNDLSPLENGQRVGGRHLATATVELERALPRNFGIAAFYDIGNAFNSFGDPMEYSVGLGVRWHIAVASLGIDVAQPLSESGSGPRLHLYISTLF